MLQRFIIALNSINTPLIAIAVVILGCIYSVVCKDHQMNAESAAGIIGAGIGLLTGQALSKTQTQTGPDGHTTVTQQSGQPPIPETAPPAATFPQPK